MEEIEDENIVELDEKTIIVQSSPSELPRLTPTGKISYAKTRVYTQRYRKEWETMSDFRGWLTSVADEPTRAYCNYCKKDLHAHRLSLLKHMCTMKHQRSALSYQSALVLNKRNFKKKSIDVTEVEYRDSDENEEELHDSGEIDYSMEEAEAEEEIVYPEHKYARNLTDTEDDLKGRVKSIKHQMEGKRDKLAEAMAHVHGEIVEDNTEDIQLDMNVVSETVETTDFEPLSDTQNLSFVSLNSAEADHITEDEEDEDDEDQLTEDIEFVDTNFLKSNLKKYSVPLSNTITIKPNNKTILLSSGAKGITLASRRGMTPVSQYVFNKLKGKPNEEKKMSVSLRPQESLSQLEASTSQVRKSTKVSTRSPVTIIKKATISTDVLDTSKGTPIGGLPVSLYKLLDGRWTFVNECNTSATGRCGDLICSEKNALTVGRYKLHFDVDKYFSMRKVESLFPFIEIVFDVKNPVLTYHIPILMSPFGYSTYRGVDR